MEKAYESALAVARAFTDLSPQDDPEHPNFVDPLDRPQPIIGPLDLCELCFEPHQADRPHKTLMQCCSVFSDVEHCGKWFHIGCVNRADVPVGDWLCKSCANSQLAVLALGGAVDDGGYEIKESYDEDVDDEESLGDRQAKRAVVNLAVGRDYDDPPSKEELLDKDNSSTDDDGSISSEEEDQEEYAPTDNSEDEQGDEDEPEDRERAPKKRKASSTDSEDDFGASVLEDGAQEIAAKRLVGCLVELGRGQKQHGNNRTTVFGSR